MNFIMLTHMMCHRNKIGLCRKAVGVIWEGWFCFRISDIMGI